jgi:hypothetical protein
MKDAPDRTNETATGSQVLNQGMEARDGLRGSGEDGAWTEIVDLDHRGIWLSRKYGLGIWRSNINTDQFIMIMDKAGEEKIVIRNNVDGPIQIFCKQDVQIMADRDINFTAGNDINMSAGGSIKVKTKEKLSILSEDSVNMDVNGGMWRLYPAGTVQNVPDNAPRHTGFLPNAMPGGGAQNDTGGPSETEEPEVVRPIIQEKIEPVDRAKTDNGPFDEVSESVITGVE